MRAFPFLRVAAPRLRPAAALRVLRPLLPRHVHSTPSHDDAHPSHEPDAASSARSLPIAPLLPEIIDSLSRSPNLVLEAPPGAGKTTAVPLALLANASRSGWFEGVVLVVEPRRVAARSAALYMASLLGQPLGREIGFLVRYDHRVSSSTRILLVTEGVLVNRLRDGPDLEGVSGVIFDEFHERSADTDLCLALCLKAQRTRRPDLRLLVMSATLGGGLAEAVCKLLGDCPLLRSKGRSFPVEVRYRESAEGFAEHESPIEDEMASAIGDAYIEWPTGDILVFLPGEREIHRTLYNLHESFYHDADTELLPLYGAMPLEEQHEVVSGASRRTSRRIVLATSIAESSLTIDGVTCVIDSGLCRRTEYDPESGMSTLVTRPVSRAVATQRGGRAGRQAPGRVYRMWTKEQHAQLEHHTPSEITFADLAPLVMQLAGCGVFSNEAIAELPWLTPPPLPAIESARAVLRQLQVLEDSDEARLTPLGERIVSIPTHPRLGRMLLSTMDGPQDQQRLALTLTALLTERDIYYRESRDRGADINLRVEALLADSPPGGVDKAVWGRCRKLMKELGKRLRIPIDFDVRRDAHKREDAGLLIALAFPDRIAKRRDTKAEGTQKVYELSNGTIAKESGTLNSRFLAVAYLDRSEEATQWVLLAAPLTQKNLRAVLGDKIVEGREMYLEPATQLAKARWVERLGSLIFSEKSVAATDEEVRQFLVSKVREKGVIKGLLHKGPKTEAALALMSRVHLLRCLCPEEPWPRWTNDALIDGIGEWLGPKLDRARGLRDLVEADHAELLAATLTDEQRNALDEYAPCRMKLPSGGTAALRYEEENARILPEERHPLRNEEPHPPVLAARLEEFFGSLETPVVGPPHAKIRVFLRLLNPGLLVVTVTRDLATFWSARYRRSRELVMAKYKRHSWPEDPIAASPVLLSKLFEVNKGRQVRFLEPFKPKVKKRLSKSKSVRLKIRKASRRKKKNDDNDGFFIPDS